MWMYVITTDSGLWGVYANRELAEYDAGQIQRETGIRIYQCSVASDGLLESLESKE